MKHFRIGNSPIIKALVRQLRRKYFYFLFFLFGLMFHFQCLNGATPPRKFSIKAPAK